MPPAITEAIHLVEGAASRGQLMGAGTRRIFGSGDQLTSGPCDRDPVRHAELRRMWDRETAPGIEFRGPYDLDDLRAATAGDDPIVVWGTHAYSDVVFVWWALDGLARIGVDRSRCFLARPMGEDPRVAMGGTTPAEALAALAIARPVTAEQWRQGGELWLAFASPSPLAFDEARRAGSDAFPELTTSAEPHGGWFPWLEDGRLRVADLDELLLGGVGDEWRTTQQILVALGEHDLSILLATCDAYFPIERLRGWAAHGVLEHDAEPPQNDFDRIRGLDRFRVTPRLRALVVDGLDRVDAAPAMYVGGCRVNDPTSPWVRVESAAGWHLAAG